MTVFDWQIIAAALYVLGAFQFNALLKVMARDSEMPSVSNITLAIAGSAWPIIMLMVVVAGALIGGKKKK